MSSNVLTSAVNANLSFPSIKTLAKELASFKRTAFPGANQDVIAVSLRVDADGWALASAYHPTAPSGGYWGQSSLTAKSNCETVAKELLSSARAHAEQAALEYGKTMMPTADQRTEDDNSDIPNVLADDVVLATDEEPEEGDWYTCDHSLIREWGGGDVALIPEGEDFATYVRAEMDRRQYWPNVWFVSDHGNAHPINTTVGLAPAEFRQVPDDAGEADTVLLTPEELPTLADLPPVKGHWESSNPSAEIASKLDAMTAAYVECALWSETDDDGNPLDNEYNVSDIHPDSLKRMQDDCEEFAILCEEDIATWQGPMHRTEDGKEAAGHDFWLTRNRHGSGFGDGDWPEGADKRLYDAARCYRPANLYVGDDGLLHYFVG